jgi:hypothetical protein
MTTPRTATPLAKPTDNVLYQTAYNALVRLSSDLENVLGQTVILDTADRINQFVEAMRQFMTAIPETAVPDQGEYLDQDQDQRTSQRQTQQTDGSVFVSKRDMTADECTKTVNDMKIEIRRQQQLIGKQTRRIASFKEQVRKHNEPLDNTTKQKQASVMVALNKCNFEQRQLKAALDRCERNMTQERELYLQVKKQLPPSISTQASGKAQDAAVLAYTAAALDLHARVQPLVETALRGWKGNTVFKQEEGKSRKTSTSQPTLEYDVITHALAMLEAYTRDELLCPYKTLSNMQSSFDEFFKGALRILVDLNAMFVTQLPSIHQPPMFDVLTEIVKDYSAMAKRALPTGTIIDQEAIDKSTVSKSVKTCMDFLDKAVSDLGLLGAAAAVKP